MKNYGKFFKILMVVLIVISVAVLVYGFIAGFETNGGRNTDILLYWAYAMLLLTLISVIVFGAIISFKNNPKSVLKLLIGLVAVAAICFVAYLLAPGKPAVGILDADQPAHTTLVLTDTLLNLTYFIGALAILAIIAGEIRMRVRKK